MNDAMSEEFWADFFGIYNRDRLAAWMSNTLIPPSAIIVRGLGPKAPDYDTGNDPGDETEGA